jgi:hypothetical protein
MKIRLLKASAFGVAIAAAMASVMLGLASCQNGLDSVLPADAAQSSTARGSAKDNGQIASAEEIRTANEQLEEIAKAVAVVVAEKNMATWLHKKCMEKFDGETNVLWKDLDADTEHAWADKLMPRLKSAGSAATSKAMFNRTLKRYGELLGGNIHVYWYGASKWDGTTTPIVTFTPIDEQLGKRKEGIAYDAKGNSQIVTEEVAKQRPVLVITRNERTDGEGRLKRLQAEAAMRNAKPPKGSTQNTYIRIRLHSFSVTDPYEDWFSGGPEFVGRFTTTTDGVGYIGYPAWDLSGIAREECNGWPILGWEGAWERGMYWDSSSHKTLYVKWIEEDPKSIITGSLSLEVTGEFKLWDFSIKPNAKFTLTLPTDTYQQLNGFAINNDHPAYPSAPFRSYNGGNPSVVVRGCLKTLFFATFPLTPLSERPSPKGRGFFKAALYLPSSPSGRGLR